MKKNLVFALLLFSIVAQGQIISDTNTLRTRINADIVPNGTKAITAAMLNRILNGYLNTWPYSNPGVWNTVAVPAFRVPYGTGTALQHSPNFTFTGTQLGVVGDVLIIPPVGTNTTNHHLRSDRFASTVLTTSTGVGSELYYTPSFFRASYGKDFAQVILPNQFNRIAMDNFGVDISSHPGYGNRVNLASNTGSILIQDSLIFRGLARFKNLTYLSTGPFRIVIQDSLTGQFYRISQADLAALIGGTGGGGPADTITNQGTGDTILTHPSTNLYAFKSFGAGNGVGFTSNATMLFPRLTDFTADVNILGNSHNYNLTAPANYSISASGPMDLGGVPVLLRGALNLTAYVTPTALSANADNMVISVSGSPVTQVRLSSTVDVNISGIDIQNSTVTQMGRLVFLHNIGSFAIRLLDQSTASFVGNRFDLNGNYVLNPSESVLITYDNILLRWRIVGLQSAVASTTSGTRFTGSSVANVDIDLTGYSTAHTLRIEFSSLIPVNDNVDLGMRLSPDFSTWNTTLYGWQFTDRDGDHDFGTLAVPDDHITAAKAMENTASSVRGTIKISNPGTTSVQPVVSYEFSYIDTFGKLQTVKGSGGRFANQAIGGVRLYITTGSNIASYDYTIYSE